MKQLRWTTPVTESKAITRPIRIELLADGSANIIYEIGDDSSGSFKTIGAERALHVAAADIPAAFTINNIVPLWSAAISLLQSQAATDAPAGTEENF